MVRKPFGDRLAAHPLACEVDLGDQVDASLLVDAEPRLLAGALDVARMQHDFDRCREVERIRQAWTGGRA